MARKAYTDGKYKQALKYYKSATTYAPKGVDLSKETAQAAYRAGDYATAEQAYKQTASRAKTKKSAVDAYNNLGLSQMKGQKYADAENSFKEALRKDPENEKARQLLAEAKRLKKLQEEKEQKQRKQQEEQQQKQNQQNQQPKSDQKDQPKQAPDQQQLRDKQTDRKLDELQRQEMETKKRLNGVRGTKGNGKSGKDW